MTSLNLAERRSSSSHPRILLGVGAGIAAYKVVQVVRNLRRRGAEVVVSPSQASLNFVGTTTWEELSENPLADDLFDGQIGHIELAQWADLIVIAPATADLLAQIVAGRANTMLTATLLASTAPKLVVPAMHSGMWTNPATQDNLAVLRQRGFAILPPVSGPLSSGDSGIGRLPEPEQISEWVFSQITGGRLNGVKLVVTAGGTVEEIDPVRYLSNYSSGRQGVEVAKAAASAGAEVILIAANCSVPLPVEHPRIEIVRVKSAREMQAAVDEQMPTASGLIMTAAVADYRPEVATDEKLKKDAWGEHPSLRLVKNPDILAEVCASPERPRIVIGFGAETGEDFLTKGAAKAKSKGADYLAVNRVGHGLGFGEVENSLTVFGGDGAVVAEFSGTKADLAQKLVDLVAESCD